MKKSVIRFMAAGFALMLLASSMTACGGQKAQTTSPAATATATPTPAKPAEPVKLSYFGADAGRINKADNPVVKELEKKLNITLEVNLVPSAEFNNKFNLMVASSSVPDISRIVGYDMFQYVRQGAFLEISKQVEKNGVNMTKYIPKEAWDMAKYQGKLYGIPNFDNPGKSLFVMRKDWLDKLGLKVPTTLDELTDVLKKFTFNDPDGNGKNDTFGYTTESQIVNTSGLPATFDIVFGAFGFGRSAYYQKDGKAYWPLISPEYKEALEYITKLYKDEKVVDPDLFILKTDQARQNLAQGKGGAFGGNWSVAPQTLMEQLKMKTIVPTAEWAMVPPIKGKNGQSGLMASNMFKNTACISSQCKNPDAAVKFIDYLMSDEGNSLANFGIPNVHNTGGVGKEVKTPDGQKAADEKWLDVMSQLIYRIDLNETRSGVSNPQYTPWTTAAKNNKLYSNLFEGLSTPEYQRLSAEMKSFELEWFVKFITGKEPLSKYDEYVKAWKDKGGKEMSDSLLKEYNQLKDAKLGAGNW